jgi:calcium-binding protein CML
VKVHFASVVFCPLARTVFQLFDFDDSGAIDASEIQQVLNNLGYHFQLGDCKRIIAAVDEDGNGEVDLSCV